MARYSRSSGGSRSDRSLNEDDFKRTSSSGNSFDGKFQSIYDQYEEPDTASERRGSRSNRRTPTWGRSASGSRNDGRQSGSSRTGQSYGRSQSGSGQRTQSRGQSSSRTSSGTRTGGSSRGTASSARGGLSSTISAMRGSRTGLMIRESAPGQNKKAFRLPKVRNESNFTIIACTMILLVIGLVMVTSSSYYYAYTSTGDSLYFFRRQFIWILISLVAMVIVSRFPLTIIYRFALPIYLASVFFCVLVLFVGQTVNGSTRWLGVGSLSFQPAELAKLAVAIYMSRLCSENKEHMGDLRMFIRLLIVLAIPTLLVAYQNLSSGIIIGVIGVVIMFLGGAKWRHFFLIIVPAFALVALLVSLPLIIDVESMGDGALKSFLIEFSYRTDRIRAWMNPFDYALDDGYQTIQALYAVGSGGFFGRGLGQSIQKLGYIPFAYNDIIFAVICEELGLFGAGIVIILFGVFTYSGVRISLFAPNDYTALLSAGLVAQIGLQAVLNIAVNTNSIPATGISLPFISYGGSSMLFLMASVGILLSISRYSRTPAEDSELTESA